MAYDGYYPVNVNESSTCVLGFDVSSVKGAEKFFSVVVLCGEKLIAKFDNAGLEKIIRLSWDFNISKIATDNIFELAEDKKALKRIISMLPESTEIIQVNLSPEGLIDFRLLLKKLGINVGVLTPEKTAYYLALLCSRGYGSSVLKKEARTKIVVRKAKSYGPGGMSNNRYKRGLRATMLQMVNEIKDILEKNKFEYEVLYRRSKGGLDGAVFTVYAPKEKLAGLVAQKKSKSVIVELKPDVLVTLNFEKEHLAGKPLIVGIDPGLSVGIAILDVDGNPLYVDTKKRADRAELIDLINSYGTPVIVATDVNPVPETVKKIASIYNAELYVPNEPLSVEYKRQLLSELNQKYDLRESDSHTRDAYSAAFHAYKSLRNKLDEVDKYISNMRLPLSADRIKKEVIRGKSISDAVEEELRRYIQDEIYSIKKEIPIKLSKNNAPAIDKNLLNELEAVKKENLMLKSEIKALYELIERKEREITNIKKKWSQELWNEEIAREFTFLKNTINELLAKVAEYESKVSELSGEIRALKQTIADISHDKFKAIPIVTSLTKSNLNKLSQSHFDYIFVENPDSYQLDAIEFLKSIKVKGILVPALLSNAGLKSLLEEAEIPVVSVLSYQFKRIDDTLIIESAFEKEVERSKKELIDKNKSIEKEKLEKLINKYKKERFEELKKLK